MSQINRLAGWLLARLQRNNPFYFLSAACMLAGCLAVTNSLSWVSIPMPRLLILIATLNLYEAVVIALAFYLIRVRNLVRDGVMLLILEGFFLIDATFLNAELATVHTGVGLLVNVLLFLAAVVKLYFVTSLLSLDLRRGRALAILAQVAALFALPIVLRSLNHGEPTEQQFYAAWWCVGAMVPICLAINRLPALASIPVWARRMAIFYLILPWFSLVLHLSIAHYVYAIDFYGAELAPMFLAVTLAVNRANPTGFLPKKDLLALKLALPVVAVLVSLSNPDSLRGTIGKHFVLSITPTRLAGAGTYLTYGFCFAPAIFLQWIVVGVVTMSAWTLAPNFEQATHLLSRAWNFVCDIFTHLMPKTGLQWGIYFIASAFALLGVGAAVSVGKREPTPPPAEI